MQLTTQEILFELSLAPPLGGVKTDSQKKKKNDEERRQEKEKVDDHENKGGSDVMLYERKRKLGKYSGRTLPLLLLLPLPQQPGRRRMGGEEKRMRIRAHPSN